MDANHIEFKCFSGKEEVHKHKLTMERVLTKSFVEHVERIPIIDGNESCYVKNVI